MGGRAAGVMGGGTPGVMGGGKPGGVSTAGTRLIPGRTSHQERSIGETASREYTLRADSHDREDFCP
jgi:hypothetical protein